MLSLKSKETGPFFNAGGIGAIVSLYFGGHSSTPHLLDPQILHSVLGPLNVYRIYLLPSGIQCLAKASRILIIPTYQL